MLTDALKLRNGTWKILKAFAWAELETVRTGCSCSCWCCGRYTRYFICRFFTWGEFIISQLINIEETGRKPKVIFFYFPGTVSTGIQPHIEIEIAPANFTGKRIDLYKVACIELYISFYAIQLKGVFCQLARDIGYFNIGKFEHAVVPQLCFRTQP